MENSGYDSCPLCGSEIEEGEYNGDWKEFSCVSDSCSFTVERPVSNPSDGFTMSDLQDISDFNG